MNSEGNIQRPRMLANVPRLLERREAHATHSCGHPEAKPQSRATVKEPRSGRAP